jgi:hypothetical protein
MEFAPSPASPAWPTGSRPAAHSCSYVVEKTMEGSMSNEALIDQLLQWIGDQPRGYQETMDAWRTSCPRLTIWEDALSDGLIERIPGPSLTDAQVQVTEKGRQCLQGRVLLAGDWNSP